MPSNTPPYGTTLPGTPLRLAGGAHSAIRRAVGTLFALPILVGFAAVPTAPNVALALSAQRPAVAEPSRSTDGKSGPGDLAGVVMDAATAQPLYGAHVMVSRNGALFANASTDPLGRFSFRQLPEALYEVEVRYMGFLRISRSVQVGAAQSRAVVRFEMEPAPTALAAVEVTGVRAPAVVDLRTGNQRFRQDNHHLAPTITTSQILQQSIAGAARAPTGEVHIRGQHAEYTYYIDGIPVPAGISGSLNELFDPAVVNEIDFQTGGWDAEYGNRNAAVINIATRIPSGGFRWEGSAYAGSFGSAGQGLTASTNVGRLGIFASAARQATDMRREPVIRDSATRAPLNFHNEGEDLFSFVKVQYTPSARNVIRLAANWSRSRFGVPYDSTGGMVLDDRQRDLNAFVNLGWHRALGSGDPDDGELFVALYRREAALRYDPGASSTPQFIFHPDTATAYNIRQNRRAGTTGLKLDHTLRRRGGVQLKAGVDASMVLGHELFQTHDADGRSGPTVNAAVRGGDLGLYAQASIAPSPRWELRPGVRFDSHVAPLAGTRRQVSPRLRLNLYPSAATTLWLYYGRLFVPTEVEDFHVLSGAASDDSSGLPTLPERDHFFEIGAVRRVASGFLVKVVAYHKRSAPAVDDNTLPGTALTAAVNLALVRVTGVESVIELQPRGPLSGSLNVALNHAYGRGPITGGFFPTEYPTGTFDLDHDQRLSIAGNATYRARAWYLGLTGIYGSGLTNGHPEAAPNRTGLFDFNRAVKVDPSLVLNASVGTTLTVGGAVLRPRLHVDNVFDRRYILKGAFTSGAAVGRPRSVQLHMSIGR